MSGVRESVILPLNNLSDGDSEPEVNCKTDSKYSSGRNSENIPLLSSCASGGQSASEDETRNTFEDREFSAVVRAAEEAIRQGILPQRISQGSSGSYFAKNTDQVH